MSRKDNPLIRKAQTRTLSTQIEDNPPSTKNFNQFSKRDYIKQNKNFTITIDKLDDLIKSFYKTSFFNFTKVLNFIFEDENPEVSFKEINFFNTSIDTFSFISKTHFYLEILSLIEDFWGLENLRLRMNLQCFEKFVEEFKIKENLKFKTLVLDLYCKIDETKPLFSQNGLIGQFITIASKKSDQKILFDSITFNFLVSTEFDDKLVKTIRSSNLPDDCLKLVTSQNLSHVFPLNLNFKINYPGPSQLIVNEDEFVMEYVNKSSKILKNEVAVNLGIINMKCKSGELVAVDKEEFTIKTKGITIINEK